MQIRYIALLVTVLVVSTASVTVAEAEAYTVDPALIQAVQGYAAENGDAHQERWNRVLAAFGTITHANPMTAQEAQTYVDKGWNRWIPVTAALAALEQAAAQQTDPEPQQTEETDPQTNLADVDQTVIDAVTDWRNEQAAGTAHYERWDRVLAAFGTVDRNDPMTAQEAQTYVDRGWQRWVDITAILKDIEAADQPQQQQQDQPQQQQQQGALENPQYTPPQQQQQQQQANPVTQTLIDKVTDWRNEQAAGTVHYERWDRVLAAFGAVDRNDPMTAQEAQTYADKGLPRWIEITPILKAIEPKPFTTIRDSCNQPRTECEFHPNGWIKNYTHTEDDVTVYGYTIPGPTSIIIFDDKGNYISKEHKYGENRDTYTEYHPNSLVTKYYIEYRSDGTIMYRHHNVYTTPNTYVQETYYWDDGKVKGLDNSGYANIGQDICYNMLGVPKISCPSDPERAYYFNKHLHPRQ